MTVQPLVVATAQAPTGRLASPRGGYRDWRGERKDRMYRILALATGEAWANLRNVASLILTILTALWLIVTTIALIFALYFLNMFSDPGAPLSSFGGEFLASYWQVAIIPSMVILSAGLGSKLIADDFASRSIVLYFCRPLHRTDYLLGKLLSLDLILIFFSLIPAVLFNVIGLWVGTLDSVDRDAKLWTLAATVFIGILYIIFWGTIGLAFSAFFIARSVRRPRLSHP